MTRCAGGTAALGTETVFAAPVPEPRVRLALEVEQAELAAGGAAETTPAMSLLPALALSRTALMLSERKQAHYGHKDRFCDYL
ncbi:hypothetical protein HED51_11465 [Ochrobactrum grignonense]|nr:hypothetical protein [Brucella grignonensis]